MDNIRTDYMNKTIAEIVKTKPSYIAIEDLNVKGMMKNRCLSKAVASQKFYEFRARLKAKCDENGIELRCCEPVLSGGVPVSSSLIRDMLKNGDVASANQLMSCGFSYTSEVIHGDRRGRTIGFPTVNQRYPDGLVKLKFGVYSVIVRFEGAEHFGITNIGIRPTYPSDFVISETYIDSFRGDLYGKEIEICPLRFLRGETKFSSIEELKNQISKDILIAKKGL